MSGFLLGLANGTSCLAFCAPMLIPYFVAEGARALHGLPLLGRFLLGRLLGYMLFGAAAGLAGSLVATGPLRTVLFGVVYLGLALLLLMYGFARAKQPALCAAGGRMDALRRRTMRWPSLLPVLLGLLTGLSFCPPFALALAGAAESGSVIGSVWFFATFFLGTSLFLLPLPGLGGLRRFETLRIIARLAAGVVGAYYLYRGVLLIYGGLVAR
jgi:sulfite exporter TauE/SafE